MKMKGFKYYQILETNEIYFIWMIGTYLLQTISGAKDFQVENYSIKVIHATELISAEIEWTTTPGTGYATFSGLLSIYDIKFIL